MVQPANKRLVTEATVAAHVATEVTTPGTPTATALSATILTGITTDAADADGVIQGTVLDGVFAGTPPQYLSAPVPTQTFGTQPGHAWAFSGTPDVSSTLNDTVTVPALGTQSVKLVSNSSSTVTAEHIGLNINASESHLRVWVRVEDLSLTSIVTVYAFCAGLTGGIYFLWHIHSSGTAYTDASYIRNGEWVGITLPWSAATLNGAATRDKITDLRVRITPTGAGAVMNFNGLDVIKSQTSFDKGVLSLTFDDSNITQFDTAAPYMDKYGFQGTAFTLPGNLGGGPSSMTLDQLKSLQQDHGWEVASHSSWGLTEHDGFPVAGLDADLLRTRAFLRKNGFRGSDVGAYPHGRITPAILDTVRKYQYAARAGTGASNQKAETLPPADPLRIRPISLSGGTSVATITAAIDKAIAAREWLVITVHGVRDTADTYYYPVANFQAIIDYAASSGIAVRTVTDALRGINPAKVAQRGSIPLRVAGADVAATIADGMVGYDLPDTGSTYVYFAGVTLPEDALPGGLVSLEYTWTSPVSITGSAFLRGDLKVLEANGSLATTAATTPPTSAAIAVPGTANTTVTTVHDYTNISAKVTGQKYHPTVFRNGGHASDTSTGVARIIDARLIYTKKPQTA